MSDLDLASKSGSIRSASCSAQPAQSSNSDACVASDARFDVLADLLVARAASTVWPALEIRIRPSDGEGCQLTIRLLYWRRAVVKRATETLARHHQAADHFPQ